MIACFALVTQTEVVSEVQSAFLFSPRVCSLTRGRVPLDLAQTCIERTSTVLKLHRNPTGVGLLTGQMPLTTIGQDELDGAQWQCPLTCGVGCKCHEGFPAYIRHWVHNSNPYLGIHVTGQAGAVWAAQDEGFPADTRHWPHNNNPYLGNHVTGQADAKHLMSTEGLDNHCRA